MSVTRANIDEPYRRANRERRVIAGLAGKYEVTRTGLIWSVEDQTWIEFLNSWPFVKLRHNDLILNFNIGHILASAWLSTEQRDLLRSMGPQSKPWSPDLIALAEQFQLPEYVLALAARSTADDDFEHWYQLKEDNNVTLCTLSNVKLDDYKSILLEGYRSSIKGGNAQALHRHVLYFAGAQYSFVAPGTKKWVFSSDTVSFSYWLTDTGHRNIVLDTLMVRDKSGNSPIRGIRTPIENFSASRGQYTSM